MISSAVTKREHWEFPKGGVEEGEREIQTALRELEEETGVKDVRILPGFRAPIRYIYRRPEGLVSKQVVYFIGRVGDPKVVLRLEEAKDYRWATYDETYRLIRHANARILLERCHAFITGKPPPPRRDQRQPPRPPSPERRLEAVERGQAEERSESPAAAQAAAPAQPATPERQAPMSERDPQSQPASAASKGGAGSAGEERHSRRRRRRRKRRKQRS